jgi:hypothetical protein
MEAKKEERSRKAPKTVDATVASRKWAADR